MFNQLEDEDFDPLGNRLYRGLDFGATGGVMEAALRTLREVLEGKSLKP